jgi:DNA-binding winged helix-turn-helix (wHTH) protein
MFKIVSKVCIVWLNQYSNSKKIELAGMSNTVIVQGGEPTNSQTETLHDSGHAIFYFEQFAVDTQQGLLLTNGNEVPIEPKVFDLLAYLCRNADRYVLVSELHEEVWADRVVSDAAVRRAISKLRNLLGGADNQSLIKSVHKRGYKLDCEVTCEINNDTAHQSDGIQEESQNIEETLLPKTPSRPVGHIVAWSVFFLALLIGTLFISIYQSQTPTEKKLVNFSGEKISASVNKEESAVAFAGKLIGEQGFQLFHANLETQFIHQMTQNANNVTEVKYSRDQQSILFVDLTLGASKILRKNVHGSEDATTLVDGFSIISDFEESHDGSGLYFTAVKDVQGTGQVYYLDYASQDIDVVTFAHDTDSNDYRVDISPNGEYLLVTTSVSGLEEHVLSIFNTRNRAIEKRIFHGTGFYEVTWLNDKEILLLDSNEIVTLDIEDATQTYVGPNPDSSIIDIEPLDGGQFMIVRKSVSDSYFIEVELPSFDTSTQKIIATPGNSISEVRYLATSSNLIYVIKDGEHTELAIKKNDEQLSLLQTTMSLNVLDISPKDDFILLTLDGLLALLEIETNNVQYITSGGQMIAKDAVFSSDGNSVLFGAKELGAWNIKTYQLGNQTIAPVFHGYKSARPTQDKVFLLDENNVLNVFHSKSNTTQTLPYSLQSAENTNWYADQQYIYFSDFDGKETHFTVLDHNGIVINERTFSASSISASFDVDDKRSKAVLKTWPYSEAEILLLNNSALSGSDAKS